MVLEILWLLYYHTNYYLEAFSFSMQYCYAPPHAGMRTLGGQRVKTSSMFFFVPAQHTDKHVSFKL